MTYRRPPITEAVFDVQFETTLSESDIRRVGRVFSGSYPKIDELREINVSVLPGLEAVHGKFAGLKLTSPDADFVISIRLNEFGTSHLAPYNSWEVFESVAWENYISFKDAIGFRKLSRLALRYINRLDIPGNNINYSRFVTIDPGLPDKLVPDFYQISAVSRLESGKVTLNCGTIPSPLPNHSSYVIDLDVYIDSDVTQKDEHVRSIFGELRKSKNLLFEQLVTDEARVLFNGEN